MKLINDILLLSLLLLIVIIILLLLLLLLLLIIQELGSRPAALDTSQLCVSIFNAIGAKVSLQDTDRAHRVSLRIPSSNPKAKSL